MFKMATPIERKKTAKTQQSIYFAADALKFQEPKTTVINISIKVYKKLRPKTGGEISPRGVSPTNIGPDIKTGGGNGPKINRREITSLWTKSRVNTTRSVLGRLRLRLRLRGLLPGKGPPLPSQLGLNFESSSRLGPTVLIL
jgi:hypothetical protein